MTFFTKRHRQSTPADGSAPPIEISGNSKFTTSLANFWTLITILLAGVAAFFDNKSDNRIRDLEIATHTTQINSVALKMTDVDKKVTDGRELMIKLSVQLDDVLREQRRASYRERNTTPTTEVARPN